MANTREEWLRDDCQNLYHNLLCNKAQRVSKRARMIRFSVNHAWTLKNRFPTAQFLEFGVHEGKDIYRIAAFIDEKERSVKNRQTKKTVVNGFDSFEGLPENWENGQTNEEGKTLFEAGKFNVNGKAPDILSLKSSLKLAKHVDINLAPNVQFHRGWFEDTVEPFLDDNSYPIAFIHADADLYRSTLTFLDEVCKRKLLCKGSVICFDEFWNYENWQQGEYKAWHEVVEKYNLNFEYLCYHAPSEGKGNWYGYQSVSIVIKRDMKE